MFDSPFGVWTVTPYSFRRVEGVDRGRATSYPTAAARKSGGLVPSSHPGPRGMPSPETQMRNPNFIGPKAQEVERYANRR